jgi:peptidoglycan L-alanyl-D-glutamate endopeptidase CwlK
VSLDPHNLLAMVHPDLVKIIEAAAQTPQPFQVVYGLRTEAAEEQAVATGHSATMHSRHLADANYDGKACAADVAALTDGEIDWTVSNAEGGIYGQIAHQIMAAANELDLPVEWGGNWVTFKDWGHFQLPWAQYP